MVDNQLGRELASQHRMEAGQLYRPVLIGAILRI